MWEEKLKELRGVMSVFGDDINKGADEDSIAALAKEVKSDWLI